MKVNPILLGTLAYTLSTFTLAVVWHIVLFEDKYLTFGYFEGDPSFLLGLTSIVIQGAILSFLFPHVKFVGSAIKRGLLFSGVIGVFFWTSHVLAFVAKQQVAGLAIFMMMESFYLALQFCMYGLLIGIIYDKSLKANPS